MNIGTITANLVLNDRFSSGLMVAARNIDQIGSKFTAVGQKLDSVGTTLTTRLTLPLVGVLVAAVKFGSEFQRTMNLVGAVSNASAADMKRLSDAATEWGQKTKFSNTEAAEAMLELAKAGFTTQETIDALPATLELATAANLSLADAASLTSNTLKTFGLQTTDLAHANDILAAAANKSTIDVADLRESLKFVGPVAKIAGVSLADVAAASAALGSAGIKAEMGGTALRGMLSKLLAPTKDTVVLLKELGFQQELAAGKTVNWTTMLDRLKVKIDEGKDSADKFAGMVMEGFGQRAGPAVIAMANQGGEAIRKLSEELDKNSLGAAKRMQDAYMTGLPGALERFKGAIDTAMTKISDAIAGPFSRLLDMGTKLAEMVADRLVPAFMALPGPIQDITIAMLGLSIVAGPFMIFLGTVARLGGVAASGIGLLSKAFQGLAQIGTALAAFKIFRSGDWMIPNDAVAVWVTRFTKLADVLSPVVGWITRLGRAASLLLSPWVAVAAAAGGWLVWLAKTADLGPLVTRIFTALVSIADDLAGIVGGGLRLAWRAFLDIISPVTKDIADLWTKVRVLYPAFYELAKAFVQVNPWVQAFKGALAAVMVIIEAVARRVDQVRNAINALLALQGRVSVVPTGPQLGTPRAMVGPKPVPEGDPFAPFLGPLATPGAANRVTGTANAVAEALAKIRDRQAELVIQARAWAQFATGDVAKLPQKVQEDYHGVLQDVIDQFGSLKAAGLDAYEGIFSQLDRLVGKTREHITAFRQLRLLDLPMEGKIDVLLPETPGPKPLDFRRRHTTFQNMPLLPVPGIPMTGALSQPPTDWAGRWMGAIGTVSRSFQGLAQIAGDSMSTTVRGIGTAVGSFDQLGTSILTVRKAAAEMGDTLTGRLAAAAAGLPGIIASFAQLAQIVGTNRWGEAGRFFRDIQNFSVEDVTPIDRLRAAIAGLQEMAGGITSPDLLESILGRMEGMREAIQTIESAQKRAELAREAMDKYGISMDDLLPPAERARVAIDRFAAELDLLIGAGVGPGNMTPALVDGFNEMLRVALETGQKLPATMRPFLETLIRSGEVAEDVARKMLGMQPPDLVPWKDMEEAAKKYGISIDKLGEKFHKSKLLDAAKELADDWAILAGNGADINAVIDGMSGKANEFLQNAKKWGLEVPVSMKPMLEAMLRAGKLTDENGVKLDSLDDVNWGLDLKSAVDSLIKKLDQLINKILGIPDPTIDPKIDWPDPPDWLNADLSPDQPRITDDDNTSDEARAAGRGFGVGSRGLRNFNPSGEWVQLHGREEVLTAGQSAGIAQWVQKAVERAVAGASGGSSSAPQVNVFLGDEQLRPRMVEWNTRALERNDGGGAAVGPTDRVAKAIAKRLPAYQ